MIARNYKGQFLIELAFSFALNISSVIIVAMNMKPQEEEIIGKYQLKPAVLIPYSPEYPAVAAHIAKLIKAKLPSVIVEHIGSTAIPNCNGKGIIDLIVSYPEGRLEITKEILQHHGFQPQPHRDPFPEDRPMLVGSIAYRGEVFQIHIHVIQQENPEIYSTLKFRDRLRKDKGLVRQYIECKKQILQSEITDSLEYCLAKQAFIKNVLSEGFK